MNAAAFALVALALAAGALSVSLTVWTLVQERRDRGRAFQELRRLWDAAQTFHKYRGRLNPDAVTSLRASFASFPPLLGESPEDRERRWDELAVTRSMAEKHERLRELVLERLDPHPVEALTLDDTLHQRTLVVLDSFPATSHPPERSDAP